MTTYRALVGGDYDPTGRRIEQGDTVDDLTVKEAKDLLAAGMVEKVEDGTDI